MSQRVVSQRVASLALLRVASRMQPQRADVIVVTGRAAIGSSPRAMAAGTVVSRRVDEVGGVRELVETDRCSSDRDAAERR